MTLKSPKAKGDGYERAIAKYLNDYLGLPEGTIRRAPLSGGGRQFANQVAGKRLGIGSADLDGAPGLHVECKRTERLQPYVALEQAEASVISRNTGEIPLVVTRRNKVKDEDSLAILRLKNFMPMYMAWLRETGRLRLEKEKPSDGLGF